MNDASAARLAGAIENFATLLEVLVGGLKPSAEAKLLGVSTRTVSRRRQARRAQLLLRFSNVQHR